MSCAFEEDLTAYVDRELPPLRLRQMEDHLPGCPGCAQTLELLQRTVRALEAMPAFSPSAQLRRDVLNRISAEPASLWDRLRAFLRPLVLVPALSAAALLAVAVVATQYARRHEPPLQEGQLVVADISELELVQNMDLVDDLEVLGLESPEDLEVVDRLQELEGQP
jgi:anti-sigma factor RsiW